MNIAFSGSPASEGHKTMFVYSARGSRLDDLKAEINPEDTNIRFVPFAPSENLMARLSAPDIHIVSLAPHWTGVAFPSKFFGAIAVGRPILFEGSPVSGIARYIKEYSLGWVLTEDNLEEVADDLMRFSADEDRKQEMFKHCHSVYQERFAKKVVLDGWNRELQGLYVIKGN